MCYLKIKTHPHMGLVFQLMNEKKLLPFTFDQKSEHNYLQLKNEKRLLPLVFDQKSEHEYLLGTA